MVPCEAARATAPAMMSLAGLVSTYRIKAVRNSEAVSTADVQIKGKVAAETRDHFHALQPHGKPSTWSLCETADEVIMARLLSSMS